MARPEEDRAFLEEYLQLKEEIAKESREIMEEDNAEKAMLLSRNSNNSVDKMVEAAKKYGFKQCERFDDPAEK